MDYPYAIEMLHITKRFPGIIANDDITLQLKVENGVITDGKYVGSGCAISQASVDMMVDQIIGKSKEEAIKLAGTFMGMIKGEITDEESIESLDEAASLQDVRHMPARVKCAVLGWHTMQEMLEHPEKANDKVEE